jgi:hypothetical protein
MYTIHEILIALRWGWKHVNPAIADQFRRVDLSNRLKLWESLQESR